MPKAYIEQNQLREGAQLELRLEGANMTGNAPRKPRFRQRFLFPPHYPRDILSAYASQIGGRNIIHQFLHGHEGISRFLVPEMTMIAFASLVVVAQDAFTTHDQGKAAPQHAPKSLRRALFATKQSLRQ